MKVAHVITGLAVGGAEMMLYKLLSALPWERFDPLVISLAPPGPMGARIAALGVPVQTLGMARGLPSPAALGRLVGQLRAYQPDLIQTWMYHADLLGTLALPALRQGGRWPRLVWNIRQSDLDPRLTRRTTRLVARLDAGLSHIGPAHIVCCSERARAVHIDLGYRAGRISVIGNGFELERFRPDPAARAALRAELRIGADTPLVGLVARLDPQKDVPGFLAAAARVYAARPDCRFLLCGEGLDVANAALVAEIAAAGLSNATHLLGRRDDTPRVFAALDLLCSASAYGEGFPNVLGEAMACGVPCVATDVGDSAMIVAATGRSVPPRDPSALAAALLDLLAEDAAARARRGAAARARVASDYGLAVIAGRYAGLYQSLLEGAR